MTETDTSTTPKSPSVFSLFMSGLEEARTPGGDERRLNARQELIEMMGVPVKQGEVMAGDIRTPYIEAGSGFPLVMIHGMGSGSVQFFNIVGPLSKHFRVIAPDQPGFGEADNPKAAYDHDFYGTWLYDTIEALNLQDIYLLGASMGNGTCVAFASRHSARIKKYVISVGAGFSKTGEGVPRTLSMLRQPIDMVIRYTLPSEEMIAFGIDQAYRDPSVIPDALITYNAGVYGRKGAGHFFWRGRGSIVSPLDVDELKKITSPTLMIWGAQDQVFPLVGAKRAVEIIPNAKLIVFDDSGHDPIKDNEEKTLNAILEFLL